jgi:hypothetical protein
MLALLQLPQRKLGRRVMRRKEIRIIQTLDLVL